jgi:hypothetical protein
VERDVMSSILTKLCLQKAGDDYRRVLAVIAFPGDAEPTAGAPAIRSGDVVGQMN